MSALLDHPNADRRALILAEVRRRCAVLAAEGREARAMRRTQIRDTTVAARADVLACLVAGRVHEAHSVAGAAIDSLFLVAPRPAGVDAAEVRAHCAESDAAHLRARVTELTAALRHYAPTCERGRTDHVATWREIGDGVRTRCVPHVRCDAHRGDLSDAARELPHAATLRSLDAACAAIDGAATAGPQGVDANGSPT